jgi:hypothetical protein
MTPAGQAQPDDFNVVPGWTTPLHLLTTLRACHLRNRRYVVSDGTARPRDRKPTLMMRLVWLGHADAGFTVRTYVHARPEDLAMARDALAARKTTPGE